MMGTRWTPTELGDLHGKHVIVTGANSGIGYHTALELGRAGADVVIACRDPRRGATALAALKGDAAGATFRLELLDLASLDSVHAFADRYLQTGAALDLLVNNAGLMAPPKREQTKDGFERQLGTNHLGHFALTGLLLPALRRSKAPRVVVLSSGMAYVGKLRLDDLQHERRYSPMFTYAQSKLANLAFMLELGRREPWLTVVAAHPGATFTELQKGFLTRLTMKWFGQPAAAGALPTLRAAIEADPAGKFFGPANWFHMRGAPVEVKLPKRAFDEASARALWDASEALTHVHYGSQPSRA